MKLGYIGLGNQGAPMAKRLADWPDGLVVYDVRTEAMTPLAELGANLADDVATLRRVSVVPSHGGNGLAYVPVVFADRLCAAGLTDDVVTALMNDNPRALFESAARKER